MPCVRTSSQSAGMCFREPTDRQTKCRIVYHCEIAAFKRNKRERCRARRYYGRRACFSIGIDNWELPQRRANTTEFLTKYWDKTRGRPLYKKYSPKKKKGIFISIIEKSVVGRSQFPVASLMTFDETTLNRN